MWPSTSPLCRGCAVVVVQCCHGDHTHHLHMCEVQRSPPSTFQLIYRRHLQSYTIHKVVPWNSRIESQVRPYLAEPLGVSYHLEPDFRNSDWLLCSLYQLAKLCIYMQKYCNQLSLLIDNRMLKHKSLVSEL